MFILNNTLNINTVTPDSGATISSDHINGCFDKKALITLTKVTPDSLLTGYQTSRERHHLHLLYHFYLHSSLT